MNVNPYRNTSTNQNTDVWTSAGNVLSSLNSNTFWMNVLAVILGLVLLLMSLQQIIISEVKKGIK